MDVLLFCMHQYSVVFNALYASKNQRIKSKSIISKKHALLYTCVTFILPLLSFIFIVTIAKKDRDKTMADMKS